MVRFVSATLSFLILTGCASQGFNRGALQEQAGVNPPVAGEANIEKILSRKANLPKPFKLGVYFATSQDRYGEESKWRWKDEDKKLIVDAIRTNFPQELVSSVFPILSGLARNEGVKAIRAAAAKQGADAVLVIGGAGAIDRYINALGWSYFLILPALFVPGSEADTLFVTSATMWDVRNEFLYLTAEAEATTSKMYIAAFSPRAETLLEKAKGDALTKLKDQILMMMKGLSK